ncbi:MAG: hypothetical protein JWL73_1295 [Actinomycetia bacterium]|nr:hypothetical protein [Actinomycetes bacterium]
MTDAGTQGIKTVLVPVSDLTTARAVYSALLGVPPPLTHPASRGLLVVGALPCVSRP